VQIAIYRFYMAAEKQFIGGHVPYWAGSIIANFFDQVSGVCFCRGWGRACVHGRAGLRKDGGRLAVRVLGVWRVVGVRWCVVGVRMCVHACVHVHLRACVLCTCPFLCPSSVRFIQPHLTPKSQTPHTCVVC
jgi:hypothetical protein